MKTAVSARFAAAIKPRGVLCATPQNYNWLATRTMSTNDRYKFDTLVVSEPTQNVLQVELNRPDKRNAMNQTLIRYVD